MWLEFTCDNGVFSRFCVAVRRLPFPVSSDPTGSLPGHVITIAPPLRIENLLPTEMHYRIVHTNSLPLMGGIKPGKRACLVTVRGIQIFV